MERRILVERTARVTDGCPGLRSVNRGGSYPEHGYARTLLTRKRVGSELDMVDFGPRSLAAFEMLGRSVPVRCPKPAALPAGIRIVNPTVEILSIEVERVGKTHRA
jgi:hypothetical protein